jgi:hypothetical protein
MMCIFSRFRNTAGKETLTQELCSSSPQGSHARGVEGEVSSLRIIRRIRKQLHFSCLFPSSLSKLTLDLPLIMTNDEDITACLF